MPSPSDTPLSPQSPSPVREIWLPDSPQVPIIGTPPQRQSPLPSKSEARSPTARRRSTSSSVSPLPPPVRVSETPKLPKKRKKRQVY